MLFSATGVSGCSFTELEFFFEFPMALAKGPLAPTSIGRE